MDQLRAFEAIAECGGCEEASRRIGTPTPVLRARLRELDQRLNTPVFEWPDGAPTPTAAGAAFLVHAKQLLQAHLAASLRMIRCPAQNS